MELLVPLVIVLVICLLVVLAARYVGRAGRARQDAAAHDARAGSAKPSDITRERAAEAGARLSPEAHRNIYSLIAQGQQLQAVRQYRRATGCPLGESVAAVTALERFPQEPRAAEPPASAPGPEAHPAGTGYRYRAIVSRGDEVREVASTRLNDEIYGQIRTLALAGKYDDAAHLLLDHADIGEGEAREFVSMIGPEA
ncbi:hypothetical protein [Specibacter cremeus]|uniref:hypothetical protein n=1 Tax=Specibacter cremeus TaxID=1629051 RepID=UPI000F78A373|nr:hypothetical protein [Specibacter cremeus]